MLNEKFLLLGVAPDWGTAHEICSIVGRKFHGLTMNQPVPDGLSGIEMYYVLGSEWADVTRTPDEVRAAYEVARAQVCGAA